MMTSPEHRPTLREQLDAVRPDSEDLREDDLQEAARAVEESSTWRDLLAGQQAFDRRVSSATQDVDVPEGLQSRLLASLAAAREESEVMAAPAKPDAPVRRRRLVMGAATAAGLALAVALGFLFWSPDGSQITLEYARHELLKPNDDGRIDVSGLPPFDDSFAFQLPGPEWMRQTHMTEELKGVDWTGDARHDGAVYAFHVGGRVYGYLLTLPASRLTNPPSAARLSATGAVYRPLINTAWVDQTSGLAHICFVERGDLDDLLRALYPHAA